jgi:hypothetical protein
MSVPWNVSNDAFNDLFTEIGDGQGVKGSLVFDESASLTPSIASIRSLLLHAFSIKIEVN